VESADQSESEEEEEPPGESLGESSPLSSPPKVRVRNVRGKFLITATELTIFQTALFPTLSFQDDVVCIQEGTSDCEAVEPPTIDSFLEAAKLARDKETVGTLQWFLKNAEVKRLATVSFAEQVVGRKVVDKKKV